MFLSLLVSIAMRDSLVLFFSLKMSSWFCRQDNVYLMEQTGKCSFLFYCFGKVNEEQAYFCLCLVEAFLVGRFSITISLLAVGLLIFPVFLESVSNSLCLSRNLSISCKEPNLLETTFIFFFYFYFASFL